MNYPSLVSLREVAPRDGWQKFKTVLPTEVKRELICSMIDYGARELEIGVFSSDPVRGRQYQDLDSLCQMVLPYAAEKGVRVTALVESVEAARRASTLGIRHVDFFLSVSDTFGRGFGSTPVEAFATLEAIASLPDLQVQAALGAVFGCPFGDATPLENTLAYARRAMELGASSLGLGDSAGMADPIHTERILRGILERFRPEQISLHIHNTEGFGLANCVKARELGFTRFDVLEMSRNVQSGNTQNLKSMVIQRSFPKWSVAERRKTAAASDQAAVCACAHSRYFAGGSPSGLRV